MMRPMTFQDDYVYVKKNVVPNVVNGILFILGIILLYAAFIFYAAVILNYFEFDSTKTYTCPEGFTLLKVEHSCIESKYILVPKTSKGCNATCELKNFLGIYLFDLLISPLVMIPIVGCLAIILYFQDRCTTCYRNSYLRVQIVNKCKRKRVTEVYETTDSDSSP